MKTEKMMLILILFLVVLAPAGAAQSNSAQTATEKPAKKARHVYTNEDFPERPEAAPAEARTGVLVSDKQGGAAKENEGAVNSESKPSDSPKTAESSDPAKSDEKAPDAKADAKAKQEAKIKELEEKLAQAKKSEQVLRDNLDDLEKKAGEEKSDFRRNMYLDMVSNQQVTLSEFRRTQEQLQKQIDDEKSKMDK